MLLLTLLPLALLRLVLLPPALLPLALLPLAPLPLLLFSLLPPALPLALLPLALLPLALLRLVLLPPALLPLALLPLAPLPLLLFSLLLPLSLCLAFAALRRSVARIWWRPQSACGRGDPPRSASKTSEVTSAETCRLSCRIPRRRNSESLARSSLGLEQQRPPQLPSSALE